MLELILMIRLLWTVAFPKSGDIVIALIDNDFTVKRLMIDSQFQPPKVWLKAENPDYQNIYIEEGQELVIWGVVTITSNE
jgi:DNA polymerase V